MYTVTVMNMNALVIAVACPSTAGVWRTALQTYAAEYPSLCGGNTGAARLPDLFLLSFALIIMFTFTMLPLFQANGWNFRRQGSLLDFFE
jgi:hypothetical protein